MLSASSNIISVIVPPGANNAPIKVYTASTSSNTSYTPSPNNNVYFTQTFSPNKQSIQDFDFETATKYPNCPINSINNNGLENFVGDMDGDALPDFVSWSSDSLFVFLNTSSNGNISLDYGLKMKLSSIKDIAFADFDTDGKLDFVVSLLNGAIYIYKNVSSIGNIAFNYPYTLSSPTAPINNSFILSTGDLNNDAKPDIAAFTSLSASSKTVNVFLNNSLLANINFTWYTVFSVNSVYKKMNICDIDNDGKNDIVAFGDTIVTISNWNTTVSEINILRNNSNAGLVSFLPEYKMKQNFYGQMRIADLDGDNKLDFLGVYGNYNIVCFKNACSPTAINFITTVIPGKIIPYLGGLKWSLGDINGDGKLDIIAKNFEEYNTVNGYYYKANLMLILNQSNANGISFNNNLRTNSDLTGSNYSDQTVWNMYFSNDIYNHINYINVCDLNADGKSDIINTDLFDLFVYKNKSTNANANLLDIFIDQGNISPLFHKNSLQYYDSLSTNISSIKLTPILEDAASSIQVRINGSAYSTILLDSTINIPLIMGNNNVDILVTAPDGVTTKNYSLVVTRTSLITQLKIKAFLQGLYVGSQQMITSIMFSNMFYNPNYSIYNMADTITIENYSSVFPFPKLSSQKTMLDISGNASAFFNSGGSYYVVIKHRNSIETWSAAPVNFSATSPITYDFSSAQSQAFGDNLIFDGSYINGVYMIYTGDINQDGSVDFNDYPILDHGSSIGFLGYTNCDLNGDASVDFNDYPMLDVNSSNGVIVQSPQ